MNPALGRLLVIAPHPDDEVLGCGGTIARMAAQGAEVHVAVVTRGSPPAFTEEMTERVRSEAKAAHACLGVQQTHWLDLPAAQIAETPHATLNRALLTLLRDVVPDTLLIPFVGDVHMDHQLIFLSSLVAARPTQSQYPRTIMAYETVSETNWNAPYVTPSFVPNVFIDIASTLDRKLEAASMFASQIRDFPHERSIETLRALAIVRGTAAHLRAAEAFVLLRNVI
ncbi:MULTISPECIES: PIG-L deacetylase family protein [unclassified Mesorhizobium]|uniref:PIG-L deacetylase family protein n=1 Tax=unclassified Mesorhizobium TaxID=325217 RepID=UPI00112D31E1|nr:MULTISPECIES: PIG-L deacetylase family protein [unclassified Mesorhizobium]MBZ9703497.1 PIG-L family deacetylase [Mesorhizobium sp. CO1-1-3]MBZ9810358.1 PIG-L family deacetylase [Mesorhizobium sp. ESP-6-2]MBZ9856959.1 PIG-L family deacetylase [Mesorhizobium sp. CA13]MBZ9872197.1 PIG-L family deacetylase [Mesorhizobium sp. BR1-1-9]MBZ9896810.1 PIG-L family deacetylase [Mesorhizobium sp. BR1-1-6]